MGLGFYIENESEFCYDQDVVLPNLATERGWTCDVSDGFIFSFCRGGNSGILYLQMAGRKRHRQPASEA